MNYLYARCLFKSEINPDLDFYETRFLKVLSVVDNEIELVLEDHKFNGPFIVPKESTYKPVKISFKDFSKTLDGFDEVLLYNDSISSVYLRNVSDYNPKYNYVYNRIRRNEIV